MSNYWSHSFLWTCLFLAFLITGVPWSLLCLILLSLISEQWKGQEKFWKKVTVSWGPRRTKMNIFTSQCSPTFTCSHLAVKAQPHWMAGIQGLRQRSWCLCHSLEWWDWAMGPVTSKVSLVGRCLGSNCSTWQSLAGCHTLFILGWHNRVSL